MEEEELRIVAGRWAGVALASPGGRVRPTAEDLRDAWMSGLAKDLSGARVLDLFAGTGALGLEALSRGAASADFVENGPPALHALKANVAKLRARDRTRIFKRDVFAFLEGVEGMAYEVALADPPYNSEMAGRLATLWIRRPFSRILSIEHATQRTLPSGGARRVFGETTLTTYRLRRRP